MVLLIVSVLCGRLVGWSVEGSRRGRLSVFFLLGQVLHILGILLIEHAWVLVTVQVALGWVELLLLDLHLGQSLLLLRHLLSLLFLLLLSIGLSFLGSLNFPEFVEDVLVVQQSVGKLFFEHLGLQEPGDSLVDFRCLENFVDGWSLVGVFVQH